MIRRYRERLAAPDGAGSPRTGASSASHLQRSDSIFLPLAAGWGTDGWPPSGSSAPFSAVHAVCELHVLGAVHAFGEVEWADQAARRARTEGRVSMRSPATRPP